jgi:4-aminobutyrate aminotransferase-like enzyme/Ser/Thr protein kinase RdoA (MazF antagonist)
VRVADATSVNLETDPLLEPRPAFTEPQAARLLADLYGLEGTIEPLHGERDLNFKVTVGAAHDPTAAPPGGAATRFVLKIHNPVDGAGVVEMRTLGMARVRALDPELPLPDLVTTTDGRAGATARADDGRTSEVQLFGFLEGRQATSDELDDRALFGWGRVVARLGRALRGYFHPAAGYRIQWDVRQAPALRNRLGVVDDAVRPLAAQVVDRFETLVAPVLPRLRAQVIHNDMSRDNVLVDAAGRIVGITDFGDMTHTALVCDLAVALADVLAGREDFVEAAEPMIAGYCSVTPLEPSEGAVLADLVAARATTDVVVTTWRLAHHDHMSDLPTAPASLLALFEREGFASMAARLGRAAAGLPYAARATAPLLAARRRVLGPLETSYDEPLHVVRGEGVRLFDPDGRSYLDAYNNVPVVGHSHPTVAAAIAAQARRLATNTRYLQEAAVVLAEELLARAPGTLERVLFVNSGSEANDVALRIARFSTGNDGALVTRFAYHGVTEATAALSPEEWPPGTAPDDVGLLDPPTGGGASDPGPGGAADAAVELAERGHPPAALFVDPGFTSDGILGPAHGWLRAAADAVRGAGGLFVGDEVQAGYGRTGEDLWSVTPSGVGPDLLTLGKPMGNGFPVAALLGRAEVVDAFISATGYFSTFGGNTLACAAALAVLHVVDDEGIVARAARTGAYLRGLLDDVAAHHDPAGAVRSWGLLCGVEVVGEDGGPDPALASAIVNRMRRLGVLVGTTGAAGNVLKIRPPLVLDEHDADEIAERLDESLAAGR